ncbi:hypothetical protein [Aquabacterium sp.]|uniref:hypothetical protein n=1 Tax=Aquabacterium sp. TaxID=1872578 RepID=UPI002488467F|nr:hypothetical protein [Aquabacterium sp.]MDI1258745.1 hypothetical protein [Aquabacterium sp.]
MPFADDIAGAADGRFLHQGLLGSHAQWQLPMGVAQARPVRRAAQALLLSATALLLTWTLALVSQAWSGQGARLPVVIAFTVGVPWMMMCWRSWQSLNVNRAVTLHWGGLPPFRPGSSPAEIPPGWSVKEAPSACSQAVVVHVVFDLGSWVLVKMLCKGQEQPAVSWSWLNARICFKGGAGHHLRALLFSPRANQVGSEQVVASSGHRQRQWSNLLSSFKPNDAVVNSDFAETMILVESKQAVQRKVRS